MRSEENRTRDAYATREESHAGRVRHDEDEIARGTRTPRERCENRTRDAYATEEIARGMGRRENRTRDAYATGRGGSVVGYASRVPFLF